MAALRKLMGKPRHGLGSSISGDEEVVWSGFLLKATQAEAWQRRFCALTRDRNDPAKIRLYYFRKEGDTKARGVVEVFDAKSFTIIPAAMKLIVFHPDRMWRFHALSEEDLTTIAALLSPTLPEGVVLVADHMEKLPSTTLGRSVTKHDLSGGWKERYCLLLSTGVLLYFESADLIKLQGAIDVSVATAVERITEALPDARTPFIVAVTLPDARTLVLCLLGSMQVRTAVAGKRPVGLAGGASDGQRYKAWVRCLRAVASGDAERLATLEAAAVRIRTEALTTRLRSTESRSDTRLDAAQHAAAGGDGDGARAGGTGAGGQATAGARRSRRAQSEGVRPVATHLSPGRGDDVPASAAAAAAATAAPTTAPATGDRPGRAARQSAADAPHSGGSRSQRRKRRSGKPRTSNGSEAGGVVWTSATTADGLEYFFNPSTMETAWTLPEGATFVPRATPTSPMDEGEAPTSPAGAGEAPASPTAASRAAEYREREAAAEALAAEVSELRGDITEPIDVWAGERNVFDLLSSLHDVFPDKYAAAEFDGALADVTTFAHLRKVFHKAIRRIHPDKIGGIAPAARVQCEHAFVILTRRLEAAKDAFAELEADGAVAT